MDLQYSSILSATLVANNVAALQNSPEKNFVDCNGPWPQYFPWKFSMSTFFKYPSQIVFSAVNWSVPSSNCWNWYKFNSFLRLKPWLCLQSVWLFYHFSKTAWHESRPFLSVVFIRVVLRSSAPVVTSSRLLFLSTIAANEICRLNLRWKRSQTGLCHNRKMHQHLWASKLTYP